MTGNSRKALKAFFITAILGPLAGALLFAVPLLYGVLFESHASFGEAATLFAKVSLMIVLGAMLLGLPASLPAALLVGFRVWRQGAAAPLFIFLAAVVGGCIGAFVLSFQPIDRGAVPSLADLPPMLFRHVLFSLVAALVLLPLLRRAGIPARAA